jgi:hypothetical protein
VNQNSTTQDQEARDRWQIHIPAVVTLSRIVSRALSDWPKGEHHILDDFVVDTLDGSRAQGLHSIGIDVA